MSDLDEAIELHQAALPMHSLSHSSRSMPLKNVAGSLHDRFEQRGILSDLDVANELHWAALFLHPPLLTSMKPLSCIVLHLDSIHIVILTDQQARQQTLDSSSMAPCPV
jgi:hypothetical protein